MKAYELTVIVRTESGRCEISFGLDELNTQERKFLFDTLRRTQKGGSGQFGLQESGPGQKTLSLILSEPVPVDVAVGAAISDARSNGAH